MTTLTEQTPAEHSKVADSGNLNVAMLLPDGRGVRNFILGPFVQEMQGKGNVQALHVIPEDYLEPYRSVTDDSVSWYPLRTYRDTPMSYLLRNCLSYSQMYWVDSFAMRFRRNMPITSPSLARRICLRMARLVGRMSATPSRIKMLD